MNDKIEKLENSIIHHGKMNDRIYLMNMNPKDKETIIEKMEMIAKKNNYSKIFAKVHRTETNKFLENNYKIEATISKYYNGEEDCNFVCKYYSEQRKYTKDKEKIESIIKIAEEKKGSDIFQENQNIEIRKLDFEDAKKMTEVYKKVFVSYPFPIFDEEYIKETMKDNLLYYGIFENGSFVGCSSSELNKKYKNAEMTDFAVLPEFRGKGYALLLLKEMENELKKQGYKTLFTIARAISYGMNITFAKLNYTYSGTLINNTNIAGSIESMNVWYKNI